MNKKKLALFIIPILAILVVSAIVYFHSVKVDATINEPLSSSSVSLDVSAFPSETVTKTISVQNDAENPLTVDFAWNQNSNVLTLNNLGGTCPGDTCEKRIVIPQSDLGFTSLADLDTISWEADVLDGYLPHVDVFLDTDNDGFSDTTLTFEYAKVDPTQCDNAPYPTGRLNTFDDKGIVDSGAYAWETIPGPCGDASFDAQHKSLADWKTTYSTADVTKIEVEVDNWIAESNSNVWEISVNNVIVVEGVTYTTDMPKQLTAQPGLNEFNVSFTYDSGTYIGDISGNVDLSRA